MTISAAQRERRRLGLAGSDAPAIIGISPWRTPLGVWLDKRQGLPLDENEQQMLAFGNALEPYICQQFSKRTGLAVVEPPDTLVHPEHEWIIGHPDRLVAGRREGMEAKLVMWKQDEWGPPDSDLVPPYVHLQCDHYMLLTGFERWHVAAQFGLKEMRTYTIERDEGIIAKLFGWEMRFWRMVLDDVRPDIISPADVARMFPNDAGTPITADVAMRETLSGLAYAREQRETWDDLASVLQAQVQGFMGENSTLMNDAGQPLATWKKSRPGKKFNAEKFRAAHPDLFAQFLEPTEGSRRFLLKETRYGT